MVHKVSKNTFKALRLRIVLSCILLAYLILIFIYSDIIFNHILQSYQTSSIESYIDLSKANILFVGYLSLVGVIVYVFFLFKDDIKNHIRQIKQEFITIMQNNKRNVLKQPFTLKKTAVFILLSTLILFTSSFFPLHIDELFTYVYIVDRGLLASLLYYPGPNNHIFYTFTIWCFDQFLPTPWAIRLPSIIAWYCTGYVLSFLHRKCLKMRYSHSLMITIAVMSALPILYYANHGRGYLFICLFGLVALVSICAMYQYNTLSRFLFVMAVTLGFYTIPVYLYLHLISMLSLFVFCIANRQYEFVKKIVYLNLLSLLFVILLYIPVLMLNPAFLTNSWIAPLAIDEINTHYLAYLNRVFSWLIGVDRGGVIYFALIGIFVFVNYFFFRKKSIVQLMLIVFSLSVATVVCIPYVQSVFPFNRVFIFITIIVYTTVGVSLSLLSEKYKLQHLFAYVFSIVIMLHAYQFYTEFKEGHGIYRGAKAFVLDLGEKMTVNTSREKVRLYCDNETYFLYATFYLKQHDHLQINNIYQPEVAYEYLLIEHKSNTVPTNYRLIQSNQSMNLYQRIVQ